jgi:hypothetical protein
MKKIAPTLREHVRNLAAWGKEDGTACREDRELKALLRVARAARRLVYIDPDGDLVWNNDAGTLAHELARALASLDRASGGGK